MAFAEMLAEAAPSTVTFELPSRTTGMAALGRGMIDWDAVSLDNVIIGSVCKGHVNNDGFVDPLKVGYMLARFAPVTISPLAAATILSASAAAIDGCTPAFGRAPRGDFPSYRTRNGRDGKICPGRLTSWTVVTTLSNDGSSKCTCRCGPSVGCRFYACPSRPLFLLPV